MHFGAQKFIIVAIAIAATLAISTNASTYRIKPEGSSARGWFRQAAVAADSGVCGKVAMQILRQNGSVVDAGIAAQLCNGVLDQPHMGIGGSSISAIYATPRNGKKKELVYISGDDRAPRWVKKSSFSGIVSWNTPYKIITEDGKFPEMFTFRDLCVGIPGEVAGYYRAWERFGKLPWEEVVQPSINLAKNGFPVTKAVEHVVSIYTSIVGADPSLKDFFTAKSGALYSIGETVKDPKLGKTLEAIAKEPLSFYKGQLADDIISDLHEYGSKIVKEDLEDYEPREIKPFEFSMFPSGCIGDSEDSSTKCQHYLKRIITTEYADYVRTLINDDNVHSNPDVYKLMDLPLSPDLQGTSHLSIVGEDGSAFLSTSSINTEFGWRHKGTKTGIMFNNRLNDFTRVFNKDEEHPKDEVNFMGPGKQARSFRMPLLILDESGNTVLGMGASGGSRIMMALLQDLFMHVKLGLKLKDAIDYPRIVILNGNIHYDNMNKQIVNGLKAKGHSLMPVKPTIPYTAVTQGVSLFACRGCWESGNNCETPCIEAVSDFRKGGIPDGY